MSQSDTTIELSGRVLGLLSDSHGDDAMTRAAVRLLLDGGAETLLHLGDVCEIAVLDELAGLRSPEGNEVVSRVVFGNMDLDVQAMSRYAESVGVLVDHPVGRYRVAGRIVVAHHGHFHSAEPDAIRAKVDYYLHGHTHRMRDERVGSTRLINPGALHRASKHTAALLDCAADELTILEVVRGA